MKDEICLNSMEVVDQEFFKLIETSIFAYEEHIYQEFGKNVQLNNVLLDQKSINYIIRMYEAS